MSDPIFAGLVAEDRPRWEWCLWNTGEAPPRPKPGPPPPPAKRGRKPATANRKPAAAAAPQSTGEPA